MAGNEECLLRSYRQQEVVMNATLENTKAYLAEAATAGATFAGNVATPNRVIQRN